MKASVSDCVYEHDQQVKGRTPEARDVYSSKGGVALTSLISHAVVALVVLFAETH